MSNLTGGDRQGKEEVGFQIPDRTAGPIHQDAGKPRETDDRRFRRRRAVAGILPKKTGSAPLSTVRRGSSIKTTLSEASETGARVAALGGRQRPSARRKADERGQFRVIRLFSFPAFRLSGSGDPPTLFLVSPSLLGYMHMEASMALANGVRIIECEWRHDLYWLAVLPPGRSHAKYCSGK